MTKSDRKWFIHTALAYLGKPYIWGGDDPAGFDCSGYVIECLKTIGILKESDDFTAHSLYQYVKDHPDFRESNQVDSGTLIFYQNRQNHIFHVAIALDAEFQISAAGGDAEVTDLSSAADKNAYIKIRPIPRQPSRKLLYITPF